MKNDHQFSRLNKPCEAKQIAIFYWSEAQFSSCLFLISEIYEFRGKCYHIFDAGKVLRSPFGLGRGHLSPTHGTGCLSMREGHKFAQSRTEPQPAPAPPRCWQTAEAEFEREELTYCPGRSSYRQLRLLKEQRDKGYDCHISDKLLLGMTFPILLFVPCNSSVFRVGPNASLFSVLWLSKVCCLSLYAVTSL